MKFPRYCCWIGPPSVAEGLRWDLRSRALSQDGSSVPPPCPEGFTRVSAASFCLTAPPITPKSWHRDNKSTFGVQIQDTPSPSFLFTKEGSS